MRALKEARVEMTDGEVWLVVCETTHQLRLLAELRPKRKTKLTKMADMLEEMFLEEDPMKTIPVDREPSLDPPPSDNPVWCVRHRAGWCATKGNAKPTKDAWSDATACGHFVIMRSGSGLGAPDCPECRTAIAKKSAAPAQSPR